MRGFRGIIKHLNPNQMEHPDITTKVKHSESKTAWNVIGTRLGCKYKIARVPYLVTDLAWLTTRNKEEAFKHASFISFCFNNPANVLL